MKQCITLSTLCALFCSLSCTTTFAQTTPAPFKLNADKQLFGYYTNWDTYGRNFQPENIPIKYVTAVLYAFAQVGNCAMPYATDANPTLCNAGAFATGEQDYLLHSTDPGSDFKTIPAGYKNAGQSGAWVKGNMGKVITLAHSQQKPALLSIIGYSLSVPFQTAIDDQHRSAFVRSIIDFLNLVKADNNQDGFDGVDADWEPNDNSWSFMSTPQGTQILQNYLSFLQELRVALKNNYASYALLTIALPAAPDVINKADVLIPGFWKKISNTTDYMDVMSYDYHGAFDTPAYTNFLAPFQYDATQPDNITYRETFNVRSSIKAYLKAGVPSSKIIMGIPAYGRAVKGVASNLNQQAQIPGFPGLYQTFSSAWNGQWDNTGTYDYGNIYSTLLKNGFTEYHNDAANATYAYNPNTDGGVFISYDNLQDIDTKVAYIEAQNLGGAMFWSLSGDIHQDQKRSFKKASLIYRVHTQFLK